MYADDGLIYGESVELNELINSQMGDSGIEVHPDKSHPVKRDGEWIRPLKFLGLEYDGKRDKLRARTRGGSTLEYDKGGDMVKAVNAIEKAVTKKERGMGVQPPPGSDTPQTRGS